MEEVQRQQPDRMNANKKTLFWETIKRGWGSRAAQPELQGGRANRSKGKDEGSREKKKRREAGPDDEKRAS